MRKELWLGLRLGCSVLAGTLPGGSAAFAANDAQQPVVIRVWIESAQGEAAVGAHVLDNGREIGATGVNGTLTTSLGEGDHRISAYIPDIAGGFTSVVMKGREPGPVDVVLTGEGLSFVLDYHANMAVADDGQVSISFKGGNGKAIAVGELAYVGVATEGPYQTVVQDLTTSFRIAGDGTVVGQIVLTKIKYPISVHISARSTDGYILEAQQGLFR